MIIGCRQLISNELFDRHNSDDMMEAIEQELFSQAGLEISNMVNIENRNMDDINGMTEFEVRFWADTIPNMRRKIMELQTLVEPSKRHKVKEILLDD